MPTIEIKFNFSRDNESHSDCVDFEVDSLLESTITDHADDLLEALNSDANYKDEWDFDEWEVECYDDDFADPAEFSDLDDYGEYVEACEKHGEGYRLRYADVGEFNFEEQQQGCWDSEKEFVQHLLDECYDVPDFLVGHIDMESLARDWMMDYSSYEGGEGTHIFRE
jgi:antirestriction protein